MAHLSHLNYALSVFSFFATEALLGKRARYRRGGWELKIENGGGVGKGTGLNKHALHRARFLKTCKFGEGGYRSSSRIKVALASLNAAKHRSKQGYESNLKDPADLLKTNTRFRSF